MLSISQSNYKDYLKIHSSSILEYCKKTSRKFKPDKINPIIKNYFGNYVKNLKELIEASPDVIKNIKTFFDRQSDSDKENIKTRLNLERLYDYFVREEKYKYKNTIYGAKYLAKEINIFTCPYCNENFTYSFNRGANRTFDWDHIYPKDIYPFFAISFFNIIPSCKVCNQIKKDENRNFLNLHNDFDNNKYFFDIKIENISFSKDVNQFELNIISQKEFEFVDELTENINVLKINDRYNEHKQIVKDILLKKRIFTKTYLDKLKEQFVELKTIDNINLNELIYSVKLSNDEFYKRPFSKLTYDILNNDKI